MIVINGLVIERQTVKPVKQVVQEEPWAPSSLRLAFPDQLPDSKHTMFIEYVQLNIFNSIGPHWTSDLNIERLSNRFDGPG